jgi:hypothetical protein
MVHTGSDSEVRPVVRGFTLSLTREGTLTAVGDVLSLRAGHATLRQDPAGGLVGTVVDLYAFARALDTKVLVPDELIRAMWTPTGAGRFADYGLGWELFEQHGTHVVQHGGAMPGFGACLSLYPTEDLYVVVLSNLQETIACEYVARNLGAIVLDRPYERPRAPKVVDVPSNVLRRYVGIYTAPPTLGNERVEVAVSAGELVMRGLASVPPPFVQETILKPFSHSRFFDPHDPHVTISFELTASGDPVLLVNRPPYKSLAATVERFTLVHGRADRS